MPRGRPSSRPSEGEAKFISSVKIRDAIRTALRDLGYTWRPYVFRSYFDTALMVAESRGKISHAYQQFWMGHKGDIEAVYTTNKGRLPEQVIEDMRAAYQRANEFLTVAPKPREVEKKEVTLEAIRSVALGFGIDPMKVRIEKQRELGREPEVGEEIEGVVSRLCSASGL